MKRQNWLMLGLFLLVAMIFFWPTFLKGSLPFPGDLLIAEYAPWSTYSYLGYVPGSFPHKAQYFDTLRQIYPWKTLSLDSVKKKELPLWNPYNFSGAPLLANFQSAVFYPLNIFYLFLPLAVAWSLLVILQPLLAGFFTYLFGREIGLQKKGAFLAGLAFAYGGFMTVFLEYNIIDQTVAWMPVAAYFFEKLLKKNNFWQGLWFFLSLTLPFLAGHLPSAGLGFAFLLLYIFLRIWHRAWPVKQKVNFSFKITLLAFLSLGAAAIQLVPTGELIRNAARAPHDYQFLVEKLLIQPQQLLMLLVPDFFGNPATRNYWLTDTYAGKVTYLGLVPLFFSFFALVRFGKSAIIRFFSLMTIIIFSLLVSWPLARLVYRFSLPLLSTSSPTNAIFLTSFCLAILAGFGIDQWFGEKRPSQGWPLVMMAFIFGLLWLFSGMGLLQANYRSLGYSSLIFLVLAAAIGLLPKIFKKTKFLILLGIFCLTILDLFYFFHKFNPFVPSALVYPPAQVLSWLQQASGFDRFWGYGMAAVQANFASQYQLFSPDGYDPLYPKRYGELIVASSEGKMAASFDETTRSDACLAAGFGETDLATNPSRKRLLDLLGVKFILDRLENASTQNTFPQASYRLVWQGQNWRVFENLAAAPRAFLTDEYRLFETQREFEEIFFAPDFQVAKTILLEREPARPLQPATKSQAKIVDYTTNKVVLSTESDADQLLFLSDSDYPGWQAFVDGQKTIIYRADYAFRAVFVPAGQHQVLFRYRPQSFVWGARISLASLILGLVLISCLKRRPF